MMHLFLEPEDVWLFRDGKPFDADGSRRAESMFPPYPSVIQGAIRTYELFNKGIDLNDKKAIVNAVGDSENYKELRIKGPFIARKENGNIVRYFPQPADAFSVDVKSHKIQRTGKPKGIPSEVITNMPDGLCLIGLTDPAVKGESGLWLSEEQLQVYFSGNIATGTCSEDLFVRENRIGIGIDNSRRAVKTGLLYEVGFIRPCPGVGLSIEVDGYTNWPEKGILRLGGESRLAKFHKVAERTLGSNNKKPLPKVFSLYFSTPTYLMEGWTTDWAKYFSKPVKLLSAAVNRYESIGGFDYAVKSHKPARRFVPAGSVFTFECQEGAETNLVSSSISDYGMEIGFGQVIAYAVNQEEMNYV